MIMMMMMIMMMIMMSRWFKKREKSHSTAGVRSGSNESVSSGPAPAKGAKKEAGRGPGGVAGGSVVTGSLRINMAALAGDKQQGAELDVPVIEDTSNTKSKVMMVMMVMMVIEDMSNTKSKVQTRNRVYIKLSHQSYD